MCNFITKLSFSYALLCVGKEVPRNPPALHAGPLRFFARPKKLGKKWLCHMVASRCESHFSVLANVYRWFNKEIEQLANQQANIVTFSEWVDGTMDSRVEDSKLFCAQIVPRRVLIVPHEYSRKKSQWALIANCEFLFFYQHYASEKRIPGKWRRQECDYDSIAMNNRSTIATDRLACPRSASSRSRRLFS